MKSFKQVVLGSVLGMLCALVIAACTLFISQYANAAGPIPVVDAITAWLAAPPAWLAVLTGLVLEIQMRVAPTANPAGFLHSLARILNVICGYALQIVGLVQKLADFSDKLFPQNLLPAPAAAAKASS